MRHSYHVYHTLCLLGLCLVLALLHACTDKEPEQRALFIELLNRNVLDKQGVRFTIPTNEELDKIGPYAEQFDLLFEPNEDEKLKSHLEAFGPLQLRLESDLEPEERKQVLDEVKTSFENSMQAVANSMERMRGKRDAFQQPPDLKEVYDKAYAKVVDQPLETMLDLYDYSLMLFDSVKNLNDFMLAHPGAVSYRKGKYVVRQPEVAEELEKMIAERNERFKKMTDCAAELQSIVQ